MRKKEEKLLQLDFKSWREICPHINSRNGMCMVSQSLSIKEAERGRKRDENQNWIFRLQKTRKSFSMKFSSAIKSNV
jgi:hypothetical protein